MWSQENHNKRVIAGKALGRTMPTDNPTEQISSVEFEKRVVIEFTVLNRDHPEVLKYFTGLGVFGSWRNNAVSRKSDIDIFCIYNKKNFGFPLPERSGNLHFYPSIDNLRGHLEEIEEMVNDGAEGGELTIFLLLFSVPISPKLVSLQTRLFNILKRLEGESPDEFEYIWTGIIAQMSASDSSKLADPKKLNGKYSLNVKKDYSLEDYRAWHKEAILAGKKVSKVLASKNLIPEKLGFPLTVDKGSKV